MTKIQRESLREFIDEARRSDSVETICKHLQIHPRSYYRWKKNQISESHGDGGGLNKITPIEKKRVVALVRKFLGPNKGKKALTLKTLPDTDHTSHQGLVVKQSGFSLHAGVAMSGGGREKIEKLCRYIARPAVALERLSLSGNGQVIYTLKKPYDALLIVLSSYRGCL